MLSSWLIALVTAAVPAQGAPVTVPFELLRSGHMAVQVKVNGKGPYRLIFDTGAPINLFSTKVGREAGLVKQGRQSAIPLFGSMGEVTIDEIDVGGQMVKNVAAIVMDHPTVATMSRALGPIEGIVGFPFFARFKTTLDYKARTIRFQASRYKPTDVLRAVMAALMSGAGDASQVTVLSPAAQWGLVAVKDAGDDQAGVTVKQVLVGGPAARAGLRPNDRLLSVDGRWTDSLTDLFATVEKFKPGARVPVRIQRDGRERTLHIVLVQGL